MTSESLALRHASLQIEQRTCTGTETYLAAARELVDQTGSSWNRIASWLRQIGALKPPNPSGIGCLAIRKTQRFSLICVRGEARLKPLCRLTQ